MSAEMIRAVAPLGIGAVAIVAILLIASLRLSLWSYLVPMLLVVILAFFDRLYPAPKLEASPSPPPNATTAAGPTEGIYWVDTATKADWGGRDWAYTEGSVPKYRAPNSTKPTPESLCDQDHLYYVAVCWDARPEGYPPGITVTDIKPGAKPGQWCTYKNSNIGLSTRPDGGAPPGRVYICSRAVPR